MGSYLNNPGSLGELSANAPTTFWSTGFFLFETPGRRPGWSLWSPPMLFMLLRVCDACSRLQVAAFASLWCLVFSHGWPVNCELIFLTAYEVLPALETTHSSSFCKFLALFWQAV